MQKAQCWARAEVLAGRANDAEKTHFRTKQRGKSSICEFSRCGSDSDSTAVYPQELSLRWRCWVNRRWPPTDPRAASASGGGSREAPLPNRALPTPFRGATAGATQESAAQSRPARRTSSFTLLVFHPSSFAFPCCHFLWLFKLGTLVAIIHSLVSYRQRGKELQLSVNKYHIGAYLATISTTDFFFSAQVSLEQKQVLLHYCCLDFQERNISMQLLNVNLGSRKTTC